MPSVIASCAEAVPAIKASATTDDFSMSGIPPPPDPCLRRIIGRKGPSGKHQPRLGINCCAGPASKSQSDVATNPQIAQLEG